MTSTNCSALHLWSVTAHDWTMCLQRSADFEQENGYPSSDRPASCGAVWDVMHAQTKQPQGHTTISSEALSGPTQSTLNNETYFLLLFDTPPHLHSDRANRALPDQPTFRTAEWRNKPDDIDMQMEKERKTWEFKGGRRILFQLVYPTQKMARQTQFRGREKRGKLTATMRSRRVIYIQYSRLDSLDFTATKLCPSISKEENVSQFWKNLCSPLSVFLHYSVHFILSLVQIVA